MNESVVSFFKAFPQTEFVNFHVISMCNTLWSLTIPKSRCLAIAAADSPIKVSIFLLLGFCPWDAIPNQNVSGYELAYPDWSSLRYITGCEASVMCNISEEFTGHRDVDPGQPFLRCPRHTLQRAIQFGLENLNITFLAGFEIEFYLVHPEVINDPSSLKTVPGFSALSVGVSTMRGEPGECVKDCVRKLQEFGISVEQFHVCGSPFQYEISTSPLPVLEAVDVLTQSLEIIRRIAIAHGYRAVFLPEPFRGQETCGLHMHLSVHHVQNADPPSIDGEAFLAGIMRHLRLLSAIGMPCDMSYRRKQEMVVGDWVSWGFENRYTPIRKITNTRWELRAIDGLSNPYLVAAAYLACGMLGLKYQYPLKIQGCPGPLGTLNDKTRTAMGIRDRMPSDLKEALDCFDNDEEGRNSTKEILGPTILDYFSAIKRGEKEHLKEWSEEDIKRLYFARY